VRFANDDALPCERVLEGSQASQRLGGLGRYLPEARTIQVRDGVSTGEVMHEMAHAWDDVRNDRVRMRDDLSAAQRADQQLRFNHQDAADESCVSPPRAATRSCAASRPRSTPTTTLASTPHTTRIRGASRAASSCARAPSIWAPRDTPATTRASSTPKASACSTKTPARATDSSGTPPSCTASSTTRPAATARSRAARHLRRPHGALRGDASLPLRAQVGVSDGPRRTDRSRATPPALSVS
jgi:hypothetical protein